MKKQYWVTNLYKSVFDIILYHDCKIAETKKVLVDDLENVLEELERNGYTRSYQGQGNADYFLLRVSERRLLPLPITSDIVG